ncbi:vicilin Cor a 11.0101-like [Wolffia australiana]
MARPTLSLLFLLSFFLLAFSFNAEDPELKTCKHHCRQQRQFSESEKRECELRCEEYARERREYNPRREGEERERWEGERNPYFFDRESFQHRIRSEHGSVRVLERFTQRSELLRWIEKYRLGIMEANPNAFVLPHHLDADAVFYVIQGCGTLNVLREENNRESFSIRKGDIVRIRAGSMVYLINHDDNEKLYIAKILRTVSSPGVLREYFAVGGENPQSFLRSFSSEILEAAFKTRRESLEKLFRHEKGAIVKASKEQIRAMRRRSSEGGSRWPFGESSSTFNLLNKRPSISSRHGQLFDADSGDYRELEDLDIQVSFANITGGSMMAPFYNTRSAKFAIIVGGEGYFEMACPHVSGEQEEGERSERGEREERETEERESQEKRISYQKIKSQLSHGSAFLIPAGHPVAIVASGNENLQLVCFEIKAKDNRRLFIAGKDSILKQLEKEAKELSFNAPAKEVDEWLGRQEEKAFMAGPEHRREKRIPVNSILDFAGF